VRRSKPPIERRHIKAKDVRVGTKAVGQRTSCLYEVLAITEAERGWLHITVRNLSTGAERTWFRMPGNNVEVPS
jgi:hypothetical protein